MRFYQKIKQIFERHRNNICLIETETPLQLTYGEFETHIENCKNSLKQILSPVGATGLIYDNRSEFFIMLLACLSLGKDVFLFHADWKIPAIEDHLHALPVSDILYSAALQSKFFDLKNGPSKCALIETNWFQTPAMPFHQICKLRKDIQHENDERLYIATSGTTGTSKWVPKQIDEIESNMIAWAKTIHLTANDRIHSVLPLYTANGAHVTFFLPFCNGASILVDTRFSALSIRNYLERSLQYGATILSIVPTMLYMLNQYLSRVHAISQKVKQAGTLRFAICGAAPLDFSQKKQFMDLLSIPVYLNYGITETLFIATQNDTCYLEDASGVPIPGMQILFSDDQEMIIQGEKPFLGYYGKSEGGFDKQGRFHTGDLGILQNGQVFIQGRKKDMIIKGGFNIYPSEIDRVIRKTPLIKDCYSFGIPNTIYGEEICSAVVLQEPTSKSQLQELNRYLHSVLPDYKVPKLYPVPEIIKTPTGKPIKREIIANLGLA